MRMRIWILSRMKRPGRFWIQSNFPTARGSIFSTRAYISKIAKAFPTPAMRRQVYTALEESLTSDHNLADKEKELLAVVSEEFKL